MGTTKMVHIYGLWTNKGGVGKTTLTFHLSTAYAHLNPGKRVVVVDMCPQANLSNTLLTSAQQKGPTVVQQLMQYQDALAGPRTVVGCLNRLLKNKEIRGSDYLTKLQNWNECMPDNMWLLCGDNRLDDWNTRLSHAMHQKPDCTEDPFAENLQLLRTFFEKLMRKEEWDNKDTVVFIDTNPAFTEYTQLALCSMDELIVPVNADDFSLQAVDYMFSKIWDLFPNNDNYANAFRVDTFAKKITNPDWPHRERMLPKISIIIHNRHSVHKTRVSKAFAQLQQEASDRIWEAYETAGRSGRVVFQSGRGAPNREEFKHLYTGTMREMFGAGVASAHTGVPLHKVLEPKYTVQIKSAFNNAQVVQRSATKNLIGDLLRIIARLTGDYDLRNVDSERLYQMCCLDLNDRAQLKKMIKWSKCKKDLKAAKQRAEEPAGSETESEGEASDTEEYESVGSDRSLRAFKLYYNSCGPDSLTVLAALTLLPSPQGGGMLQPLEWYQLAQHTQELITQTAGNEQGLNLDAQLAQQQLRVLQHMQQRLPNWQPGQQTNLEDLLQMLCTSPSGHNLQPYSFIIKTTKECRNCYRPQKQEPEERQMIHLTGDDVLYCNPPSGCRRGPTEELFDVQTCLTHTSVLGGPRDLSACSFCGSSRSCKETVEVQSLPDWLVVVLRRTSPDDFTLPDEDGNAVGPDYEVGSRLQLASSDGQLSIIHTYELRALLINRAAHHTLYFAPKGVSGLEAGWYFYDDADQGRIRPAGSRPYPTMLAGETPSNISCLIYSRVDESTTKKSNIGGTSQNKQRASHNCSSCIDLLPEQAAAVLRQAKDGWMDNTDILQLLMKHAEWELPISTAPPFKPTVGEVYLYSTDLIERRSKGSVVGWAEDGHSWQASERRGKNRDVDGKQTMLAKTIVTSTDQLIERRSYYIPVTSSERGKSKIVLVHYHTPPSRTTGKRSGGVGDPMDDRGKRPATGAQS